MKLFVQVKNRNLKDYTRKKQPYYKECKCDVEKLTYNIKPQDLSPVHLLGYFLEIGVEADAGKCKNECPVLVLRLSVSETPFTAPLLAQWDTLPPVPTMPPA